MDENKGSNAGAARGGTRRASTARTANSSAAETSSGSSDRTNADTINRMPGQGALSGDRTTRAGDTRSSGATGSGDLAGKIRETATTQLGRQKDRATEGIGSVVQAVRNSTQQLRSEQHDTAARFIEQAADQIERFSNQLKQKDVGQLLDDAQRVARRQPALFIGSAFALGLLSARFLKSSGQRQQQPYGGRTDFAYGSEGSTGAYSGASSTSTAGGARNVPGETERF